VAWKSERKKYEKVARFVLGGTGTNGGFRTLVSERKGLTDWTSGGGGRSEKPVGERVHNPGERGGLGGKFRIVIIHLRESSERENF